MSSDGNTSGGRLLRPKSVGRKSLNIGTMLKDVMNNKDSREKTLKGKGGEDGLKSNDNTVTRRSSAASRNSLGSRPSSAQRESLDGLSTQKSNRTTTRRQSAILKRQPETSTDEDTKPTESSTPTSSTPPKATRITRSATLRPRPSQDSALPKYRPKSVHLASAKPASPSRARRISTEFRRSLDGSITSKSPIGKSHSRQGSPTIRTSISKIPLQPGSAGGSPTRISPAMRKSKTTTSFMSALNLGRTKTTPSPLRKVNQAKGSDSPLAHKSSPQTPRGPKSSSESDGNDSFEVGMLLAPIASAGAPTPAMPRGSLRPPVFRTPSRGGGGDGRGQPSFHINLSPTFEEEFSPKAPINVGSLASWDQVVVESSLVMGEDEAQLMLSEIDAPFASAAPSPARHSTELLIPESPAMNMSSMPSPGGYASIAHILLPDMSMSPSPAHQTMYNPPSLHDMSSMADAGTIARLRLELDAAEQKIQRHVLDADVREQELRRGTDARTQKIQELAQQVTFLEEQLCARVDDWEKKSGDDVGRVSALQDELKRVVESRDREISAARDGAIRELQQECDAAVFEERRRWKAVCSTHTVSSTWKDVKTMAEAELDMLKSTRETLAVLLAGLDQQHQLC